MTSDIVNEHAGIGENVEVATVLKKEEMQPEVCVGSVSSSTCYVATLLWKLGSLTYCAFPIQVEYSIITIPDPQEQQPADYSHLHGDQTGRQKEGEEGRVEGVAYSTLEQGKEEYSLLDHRGEGQPASQQRRFPIFSDIYDKLKSEVGFHDVYFYVRNVCMYF